MTMLSVASDVKGLLVTAGIGTYATDLFINVMPASPDAVVCVYDTGGFRPGPVKDLRRPTVMVKVRGTKNGYVAAYAKAQAVWDALHGATPGTLNGARYIQLWAMGDIFSVGTDEAGRPELTIDFEVYRTSAT